MNDHERLHIDSLVYEACDLLCETAIQRCAGPTLALRRLRGDPNGPGVWLDRFIAMFLQERALHSDAGACAILETLAARPMPAVAGGTISHVLRAAAVAAFTEAVRFKAEEALERASVHESAEDPDAGQQHAAQQHTAPSAADQQHTGQQPADPSVAGEGQARRSAAPLSGASRGGDPA